MEEKKMHEQRGWVVVTPMGYQLVETFAYSKDDATEKFVRNRNGLLRRFLNLRYWWGYWAYEGYRVERVRLVKDS